METKSKLTFKDMQLIQSGLIKLTYEQIAEIISRPVADIKAYAESLQGVKKKQGRSPGAKLIERERSRLITKKVMETRLLAKQRKQELKKIREQRGTMPAYRGVDFQKLNGKQSPVVPMDMSDMEWVRIDAKTFILIRPGQDPEKERRRYLERTKKILTEEEKIIRERMHARKVVADLRHEQKMLNKKKKYLSQHGK